MTANFFKYSCFILRRDRIIATLWILGLVLFSLGIAAAYPNLFADSEAIASMATTLSSPPMIAMMGPVYPLVNGQLDPSKLNPAILFAQQCLMWIALAAAVMNIFFVNRYTRTDEELGRHEIIASLPVGRLTNGSAAIVTAFLINLMLAVLTGAALLVLNSHGGSLNGAFVIGFSIGTQGFVFAAITLIAAQIFSTASATAAVPFALLVFSYILRAFGDMQNALDKTTDNMFSFISPLGLGLKINAFYDNNWYPILILFAEGVIFAMIALAINTVRDVGSGIIPAKKGRAHASLFLQSPWGYVWRISRGSFVGWGVGLVALGASYGTVIGSVETFIKGNEILQRMIEQSASGTSAADLTNGFVVIIASIMMMMTAIPLISTISRFHLEEQHGRLEQLFALPVSRHKLFAGFLFIALIQAVFYPLIYSLGMYGVARQSTTAKTLLEASFVYLPALLFMVGLTVLLVGIIPWIAKIIWLFLGYSYFVIFFGKLIPELPDFLPKLTPFGYISQIPVETFNRTPMIVLPVLAVIMMAAGFVGIRKRDIGE